MRAIAIIPLFLALVPGACASSGSGEARPEGADRTHIVSEELRALDPESLDAWEAIRRLRGTWLRSRGSGGFDGDPTFPRVILDGVDYGRLDALRGFSVTEIEELEYLSASDATTLFGTGYPGGAILVTTR